MRTTAPKGFRFKTEKLGVLSWPKGIRMTSEEELKEIKNIPPEFPIFDREGNQINTPPPAPKPAAKKATTKNPKTKKGKTSNDKVKSNHGKSKKRV
jgi:hypothetical protein